MLASRDLQENMGYLSDNHWGVLGIPGTMLSARVTATDAHIIYVSSTNSLANDASDGLSPDTPCATIAGALLKCTANRGDTIYLAPKHTETFTAAGGLTINVAGVNIIGVGVGENRPILNFMTAAAASVLVSAANVYISGILFKNAIAVQTHLINVAAKDFTLESCEFREGAASQALIYVDLTGTGANVTDRAVISNCVFRSIVAGSNEAIEIGAVQDRVIIVNCRIFGDYANAGIHSGSVLTNARIQYNEIRNIHAAKWALQFTAAATGVISGNMMFSDAAATCLNPGSCMCAGNLASFATGTAAVQIPAAGVSQMPDVIISRATEALPQTGSKTLFTIAGGPVLVKQIFGTVTTVIGAVANATKLYEGAAGATDICTTLEMNACASDARVSITGTFGNAMIKTLTGVPVAPQATAIVCPTGNIGVSCAGSDGGTGRIRWTLVYQPLEANSAVTAP